MLIACFATSNHTLLLFLLLLRLQFHFSLPRLLRKLVGIRPLQWLLSSLYLALFFIFRVAVKKPTRLILEAISCARFELRCHVCVRLMEYYLTDLLCTAHFL